MTARDLQCSVFTYIQDLYISMYLLLLVFIQDALLRPLHPRLRFPWVSRALSLVIAMYQVFVFKVIVFFEIGGVARAVVICIPVVLVV